MNNRLMRKLLVLASLFFLVNSHAENIPLLKATIDRSDLASIKRGADLVAANCLSCHTMIYMKNNRLAQESGITDDRMPLNVKEWPNGVVPPDLSLVAEVRGLDWLYTYLHSFYQDASRPTGSNNLLLHDTGMINILMPYQGTQVLLPSSGSLMLVKPGSLMPPAFDVMTGDIVNFLGYAAEPYRFQQRRIGMFVIIFLIIFLLLAYFLHKEYWKDVERYRLRSRHE